MQTPSEAQARVLTHKPYLPSTLTHANCGGSAQYCDSSDYRSNDDADQTVAAQLRYAFEDLFFQYKVKGWPWHKAAACCSVKQFPLSDACLAPTERLQGVA